jgi:hypothetical protein
VYFLSVWLLDMWHTTVNNREYLLQHNNKRRHFINTCLLKAKSPRTLFSSQLVTLFPHIDQYNYYKQPNTLQWRSVQTDRTCTLCPGLVFSCSWELRLWFSVLLSKDHNLSTWSKATRKQLHIPYTTLTYNSSSWHDTNYSKEKGTVFKP